MKKLKVIKKVAIQTCWACNGRGCKICNEIGKWKESTYFHIYKGQCFSGDTIK